MSKTLGWVIKLVSWFIIYFTFSMIYDGDMPFWIYFIVVVLCIAVMRVVDHYVKPQEKKDDAGPANTTEDGKKAE